MEYLYILCVSVDIIITGLEHAANEWSVIKHKENKAALWITHDPSVGACVWPLTFSGPELWHQKGREASRRSLGVKTLLLLELLYSFLFTWIYCIQMFPFTVLLFLGFHIILPHSAALTFPSLLSRSCCCFQCVSLQSWTLSPPAVCHTTLHASDPNYRYTDTL